MDQNLSVWTTVSICVYKVLLTVKWSSLVWGHSVQFWFSGTLYLENECSYSEIDQNFRLRGKSFMHYLSLLSVQVQFEVIWCISNFDDLVSTFDLNFQQSYLYCYRKVYTLPIFFYLAIKWPSRASRPLGLLFAFRILFICIFYLFTLRVLNGTYSF